MEPYVVWLFGFIGLVAVGLIPVRLTQALRRVSQEPRHPVSFLICALSVCIFVFDVSIALRIFRCLTETYCGPSVASGWGYLAMLGVAFVAYEVSLVVERFFRARH